MKFIWYKCSLFLPVKCVISGLISGKDANNLKTSPTSINTEAKQVLVIC